MKKSRGFTLLELLVVIAIIAVLMGMLMPALRRARMQAQAVMCQHNLKELTLGWFAYTVDNDGYLCGSGTNGTTVSSRFYDEWVGAPQTRPSDTPPYLSRLTGGSIPFFPDADTELEEREVGIERGALYPYVKNTKLYHCPADKRNKSRATDSAATGCITGGYRSYSIPGGLNQGAATFPAPAGTDKDVIRIYADIRTPSDKYCFVEESDPRGWNMGPWHVGISVVRWVDPFAVWHNRRSTLGFADGHAEKRRWVDDDTMKMSENWVMDDPFHWQPTNPDLQWMREHYPRK